MSRPHPFVNEGDEVTLNHPEIIKATIARAKRDRPMPGNTLDRISVEIAMRDVLDDAAAVRAGRRWERGQGASRLNRHGALFSDGPDVTEAQMDAASAAYDATEGVKVDCLRAAVQAALTIERAKAAEADKRRAELIEHIDENGYPHFRVRVGDQIVSHTVLTTPALEDLEKRIQDHDALLARYARENAEALARGLSLIPQQIAAE